MTPVDAMDELSINGHVMDSTIKDIDYLLENIIGPAGMHRNKLCK